MFHHFCNYFFDSFFEFTAVLGSCHHTGQIQNNQPSVFHFFRHQPLRDPLGKSFYYRCFSNTRFSDQTGIVFRPAAQNLDYSTNLIFSSDHRIHNSLTSHLSQISAVLIQCRRACSRFISGSCIAVISWIGNFFSHRCQNFILQFSDIYSHRVQQTGSHTVNFPQHRKQKMFCSYLFTAKIICFFHSSFQHSCRPWGISCPIRSQHITLFRCNQLPDHFHQPFFTDSHVAQNHTGRSFFFV